MLAAVNGCQIWYEARGEGDPLLLLHGFMGVGENWRLVFTADPDGFRVIVPDLRGHGRSTNPPGVFTFRQAALDMLALLDELDVPRVKAIGLSGGGIALLHMATLQPSRVESMIVVSAPPRFPPQAKAIQARYSIEMLSGVERAAMHQFHVRGDDQLQALIEQMRAFSVNDDDVGFTPASLGTISADTLIVFGDREHFHGKAMYPVSLAFELHAAIPRSFLWVVPNGGHGPIFGPHAPWFATAAAAFLRGDWRTARDGAQ